MPQDVVDIVMQSDIDRDGIISKKGADLLATRLAFSLEICGTAFDKEKFHRAVGLSPSLCGVMTIVKHLLPDENDRRSTFCSLESDDSEEEEEDDVCDMFCVPVEEEFNGGCADSIRLCKEHMAKKGERPTSMSVSPSFARSVKGLRCTVSSCGESV